MPLSHAGLCHLAHLSTILPIQITSKATGQALPGLTHKRFSFDTEADVLGITSGKTGGALGSTVHKLCRASSMRTPGHCA